MKRRKILAVFAATMILGSTGAVLTENNVSTVLAAKKKSRKVVKRSAKKKTNKKRSSKKVSQKVPVVRVKRGALAYEPVLNKKETGISKVRPLKIKGKKIYLKSVNAQVLWSVKYKKTTYYFVKVGKLTVAVRAKDTKRLNKKRIISLSTYIKKHSKTTTKKVNVPIKVLPFDKYFEASTNKETVYWTADKDGKPVKSDQTLPEKTNLRVLFKLTLSGKLPDGQAVNIPFYCAQTTDNHMIYLPVAYVTLNDSAAEVPDRAGYEANLKDWQARVVKSIQDQITAFEKNAQNK